ATTSDAPLDPCSGAGARGQGRKYTIQTSGGIPIPGKVTIEDLPEGLPMANSTIMAGEGTYTGPKFDPLTDADRESMYYWIDND
ncbi:MAG: hypothetical protein MI742_12100, partial [Desulfobacterales bacterium]|nr:hypothetical protein [Desulfobacterales bacterium]